MRTLLIVFAAVMLGIGSGTAIAQPYPMYSQYLMNGFLINPSIAGRDGFTTANLTVREQWVGMEGAPSTYAASFQTRVLKNSYISKSTDVQKKIVRPTKGGRVGLGGYLFSDINGIMKRTGFQAAYAYHIPVGGSEDMPPNNLSFGLALTAYQFNVNLDGLVYDRNDPLLNSYDRSIFVPDFNFGASYSTPKYYLGFSMANLFRGSLAFADTSNMPRQELGSYFLTGAVKFQLAKDWILEPSALIKSTDMAFSSFQVDLTSRIYFRNDYWAGISYRTNNAVILMAGVRYDRFYFAYALDLTLSDLEGRGYETHEFTLAVRFGENARRYRWLNAY